MGMPTGSEGNRKGIIIKMKKSFTVLLAIVMCLGLLCVSAAATTGKDEIMNTSSANAEMQEVPLADSFSEMAAKMAREHYEELGYIETRSPFAKENIRTCSDISSECIELAYMDVNSAPAEMQKEILDARREIIYKADGWYVDNGSVYVTWFDDDEKTWGELPTFDELFPGWEVPVEMDYEMTEDHAEKAEDILADGRSSVLFNGRVTLRKASTTSLASPFKIWNLANENAWSFYEVITKLETSTSCNLGLTNMSTNTSLYNKGELLVNGGLFGFVNGRTVPRAGFRASTYVSPGTATISIEIEDAG